MRVGHVLTLASLLLLAAPSPDAGGAPDRLDQLRRLAASRLSDFEQGTFTEIYGLLDGELLENLNSGKFFASQDFLQERLDALSLVWGGSTFRVLTFPDDGVTVGIFQLSPSGYGTSVRPYVKRGSRFELGHTIDRPGIPVVFNMPPTRDGHGQLLLAWVGQQSGRGLTGLRMDLLRVVREAVRSVWTTEPLFPSELSVTAFTVTGREIRIRYVPRYPGWKPGCEPKTEQEDLYRYAPSRETFVLAHRQVLNGWHREFHSRAADRLLAALRTGDRRVIEEIVPHVALRTRLPERLEADPACDAVAGHPPEEVIVSAVEPEGRGAWSLSFRRFPGGWKLVGASPVR